MEKQQEDTEGRRGEQAGSFCSRVVIAALAGGPLTHPVRVDWYVDHDVYEVPGGQAGDEHVGPAAHAAVGVDDPQQRRVAHRPRDEHQQGHQRVHRLEGVPDARRLQAHGGCRWRPGSVRWGGPGGVVGAQTLH